MSAAHTAATTVVVEQLDPPAPERPALPAPAPQDAVAPTRQAHSLLQTLLDKPERFSLDAAVAVMMRAARTDDPGAAVRFHAAAGLGFVPSDVMRVKRDDAGFSAMIGLLGLTGPSGVLPRPYTEIVNAEQRQRSPALSAFLDLLGQQPLAHFAAAGLKYRPHRHADAASLDGGDRADGLRRALLALTGYGTPGLASRLEAGVEPLLFYAGLFAARPRSADRLAALLSDWLGQPVVVEQFAGASLRLDRGQRTALPSATRPGRFNQLGVDAAIGATYWDLHARVMLRIGPLSLAQFDALLPDRPLLRRFASLARAFLDAETGFAINPILAADEVPPLALGGARRSRLSWDTWLPTSTRRQRDAGDAVFDGDAITAPGSER